jgi:hypothetical protein
MAWFVILGLPIFWGLFRLPRWWRQPRPVRGLRPRDRSWLVKVVFLASLELFGIVQLVSDDGRLFHSLELMMGLGLAALAALCVVLILPVNHLSAFDFLVAPALRNQGGEGPTRMADRRVAKAGETAFDLDDGDGMRPATGEAFIRVRRENAGWQDRLRAYGVEIDGRSVGQLRRGEEILTGVVAGTHTVRAVISRTGSLPTQVRAVAERTVTLRVEPAMGSLIDGIRPDAYLRIVEE